MKITINPDEPAKLAAIAEQFLGHPVPVPAALLDGLDFTFRGNKQTSKGVLTVEIDLLPKQ